MNKEIRKLLIDHARSNRPMYYSVIMNKLGLKAGQFEDHEELAKVLEDISSFEVRNGRPMLSAMATYSPEYVRRNNLTEVHGGGFYKVAEKIGKIDRKGAIQDDFALKEMRVLHEYWSNDEHYKNYGVFQGNRNRPVPNFFQENEINFLVKWAGVVYDRKDPEHTAAKNYIMNSLGSKTVYWSNKLAERLPGFDTFNWRMWSYLGWIKENDKSRQVARFKGYTWARIFKRGDDWKDIFFTVGVDSHKKQLVYKLDYYYESDSELTIEQKAIIEKNLPGELRWKAIPVAEWSLYNWETLIDLTAEFIAANTSVYDKLIALAWKGQNPGTIFSDFLRPQPVPSGGFNELPNLNPSFEGTTKDFIQDAIDKKEIGDAGEELVKLYEKNKLRSLGLHHLVDTVDVVENGNGFDVRSFDGKGNDLFIEVKTTTGSELKPFEYTINEYLFAEKHPQQYRIYRLYNYDEHTNTADFYILDNPLQTLLLQPITFKAYKKQS